MGFSKSRIGNEFNLEYKAQSLATLYREETGTRPEGLLAMGPQRISAREAMDLSHEY